MRREDMLQMWADVQRLRASAEPTDRLHALGLIDDLCDALDERVLILDEDHCLYEHDGEVVVAEIFR